MSHTQRISIQFSLLIVLFASALLFYTPLLIIVDNLLELSYEMIILLFGFLLGLAYHTFGIVNYYYSKLDQQNQKLAYFLEVLQPSFLSSCFGWYLFLFINKLFSASRLEEAYFQSVMIGFSFFFITVKAGREVNNMVESYGKFSSIK